jgi:formylglycine-generating enzyme required for sulfatase activity
VTNTQYAFCVAQGKCSLPDTQKNKEYGQALKVNHPVTAVNYDQAAMYCDFVHGRLPTEAEWEKTARGPDGNMYPWGDTTPKCDFANYSLCENKTTSVVDHPDGMSYYEALDMAGNIFEWVADWYDFNYYDVSPLDNPLGPSSGIERSVRSNGFLSPAFESESARRSSLKPSPTPSSRRLMAPASTWCSIRSAPRISNRTFACCGSAVVSSSLD